MPKLSDGMDEGVLIRWVVADGAEVAVGDELAEIETDKATMSFEAEAAGTLVHGVAEGDSVPVGAPIAQLLAPGEEASAAAGPAASTSSTEPRINGGAATLAPPAPAVLAGERVRASPVARRIAAQLGIDLASLVGSGPRGRVVKRDVEEASVPAPAAAPALAPAAPAPEPVAPPAPVAPAPTSTAKGEVTVVPLTRLQQTVARRMAEAKSTQPDFTVTTDVAMDEAVALRERFKVLGDDVVPSYNDLVIKAVALALVAHPTANGSYRDGAFERFGRVNVGMAVAAEGSLTVPTVFDADRSSLGHVARETRRLAGLARTGSLTAPDLAGGTFTVSNLGMFGVSHFTAVLNTPQAGILAVGALEQRPVVRDGALAVGWQMSLTLTCDHRILYGADAAALLSTIRAGLEAPLRLTL